MILSEANEVIQSILSLGVIDSITFYKSGNISVKYYDEPRKLLFKETMSLLEIAEVKAKYKDK